MSAPNTPTIVPWDRYGAWLFDLDGVITRTARVHAAAWKRMFDDFLRQYAERCGTAFEPFAIEHDYPQYVDGKPRYEGVDSFLRSRGIVLEWGDPADPPDRETVCGLGNRKNALFNDVVRSEGVEVFPGSVALVRRLKEHGKQVAVVTSSRNCDVILEAAGLTELFDAKVDGNIADERRLAGKPAPDTFEAAARMLGASPHQAVVIEDAISGVAAGRAGDFGLVVGVARHSEPAVLLEHGADIVVRDLGEIQFV